ncbi:Cro/CI family transcriptional regulator [Vibrio sp. SCSIO 43136]|uniref:Cro/CI family transcriptional regulator n=1 Tax=Vibrio sp. SCSIO 43136 TaxID=2819101 RepID=UPI002075358C|nr:Cro/CI family transcriptional regulator [Vibrio sp. SCSIO 43136]USD64233.1 hypothetical protein J4N39_08930 [Vibrio sp. SCSIO 43136]
MERFSKAAFSRVLRCFNSQSEMARAFGVTPVSVHRWKKLGLPELRALQADKYLGVQYEPKEYDFDCAPLLSNRLEQEKNAA